MSKRIVPYQFLQGLRPLWMFWNMPRVRQFSWFTLSVSSGPSSDPTEHQAFNKPRLPQQGTFQKPRIRGFYHEDSYLLRGENKSLLKRKVWTQGDTDLFVFWSSISQSSKNWREIIHSLHTSTPSVYHTPQWWASPYYGALCLQGSFNVFTYWGCGRSSMNNK